MQGHSPARVGASFGQSETKQRQDNYLRFGFAIANGATESKINWRVSTKNARVAGVDLPPIAAEVGLTYIYGIGRSRSTRIQIKLP